MNKLVLIYLFISIVVANLSANTPEFLSPFNINMDRVFQDKNPEGEFLTYYIVNDSSVSVIGGKDGFKSRASKYGARTLTIPSSVNHNGKNYTIRYIQSFAFETNPAIDGKNLKTIEEVFLPNTLEIVGQNCFSGMLSLKSVTIPKSLKVIGYCMFEECPKLEEVFIPYDSKLETIGDFAFNNCPSLKYFHIPANVRYIGQGPWRDCFSLSEINVASMNEHYVSENGVLLTKDKKKIIQYPAAKTDEIYIFPSQVTIVGNSAFYGNQFLKNVVLSESTYQLEHISFYGCKNLKSVYFPNNLNFIGNGAFGDCPNLKKVILPLTTQITKKQLPDDSSNSFMPKVYVDRSSRIMPYTFNNFAETSNSISRPSSTNAVIGLAINNMTTSPMDITASTNRRYDLNNQPCALIIVKIPSQGCVFHGSIIGETNFKINEYWVYLSSGAKYLKIQVPNHPTLMVDFNKYGFTDGVESLKTYYLSFANY